MMIIMLCSSLVMILKQIKSLNTIEKNMNGEYSFNVKNSKIGISKN